MRKNYINGEWVDASSGKTKALINPATEEKIADLPFGDAADYRMAIGYAISSRNSWQSVSPYFRAEILKATAQHIREKLEEIAHDMVLESGKPMVEAKAEIGVAANLFEWFAEEGKRCYGRTIPSFRTNKRMSVIYQPLGVVGAITAWNFPAYNPARCWAAILAAGCTLVARSSEHTPLTAMHIIAALHKAGIPPGVVHFIHGEAQIAGNLFLENPEVRKISFTGSTEVGKLLIQGSNITNTRLALEMGGNAPAIICEDMDPVYAAKESVKGKFRNAGQVCIAPQRFFIHQSVFNDFLTTAVQEIERIKVGNGLDPQTQMGPLIHAKHREGVIHFVEKARQEGAKIHCGGEKIPGKGFFMSPCLIEAAKNHSFQFAEVFGPVMIVTPFETDEEAVKLANEVPFGLAAYVMTEKLNKAIYFSEKLEAGIIGVNEWLPQATEAPFGGWKESGIGYESGAEGLLEYMDKKLISIGNL
ncbi:MAG: NAD-dependent succinate-semialdehyde dehydrogenase [Bacteroidota bacterium]